METHRKLIASGLLSLIIITALGSYVMVNQANDTWDDTHWGGDVGEETYNEPTAEEEEESKSGGMCGIVILTIGTILPAYLYQRKQRYE